MYLLYECLIITIIGLVAIVIYRLRLKIRQPKIISHALKLLEKATQTEKATQVDEIGLHDINLDYDDNHNVHNLTISNSAQKYLKGIPKEYDHDITDIYKQFTQPQFSRFKYIPQVLSFIKEAEAFYSKDMIPERSILNFVWEQIKTSSQQATIEHFAFQLNDCYDVSEQKMWCLEGRIIRLLQSLTFEDKVQIVPLWYYKSEIENYCAEKLDQTIKNMSNNDQQKYFKTTPSPKESRWINNINDNLILEIDTHLKREYCDKLDYNILETIVKPCYQAISEIN